MLPDSTKCFLSVCLVQYVYCSSAQFLKIFQSSSDALRSHDGSLKACELIREPLRPEACCHRTMWNNWCYSHLPTPSLHHHHRCHQLPIRACTNQISRASTWIVQEGSYWFPATTHIILKIVIVLRVVSLEFFKNVRFWCNAQWKHSQCFTVCLLANLQMIYALLKLCGLNQSSRILNHVVGRSVITEHLLQCVVNKNKRWNVLRALYTCMHEYVDNDWTRTHAVNKSVFWGEELSW